MQSTNFETNLNEIVAEIKQLSDNYEKALIDGNFEVIKDLFWDSELALRFGVSEELYGVDAIRKFQDQRTIKLTERKVTRTHISTFGRHLATVNLEFELPVNGEIRSGRQSQTWVNFPESGWKIVSAHVSHRLVYPTSAEPQITTPQSENTVNFETLYVDCASKIVGVPIPNTSSDNVAKLFQLTEEIVQPLAEFQLDDFTEIATVFKP